MCITMHGAAAAEPPANALKAYKALKLGCMSDARPGLLVDGASSSTKNTPLLFLNDMPAGQQDAALLFVIMLLMTAMHCCRPERAPVISRWFLALADFIRKERARGATWAALSPFWRDLMKRADLRVDAFLLHMAADVGNLDPAWITDPTASYSAAYAVARAPEIALKAAQDMHAQHSKADAGASKQLDAQLERLLKARGLGGGKGGKGGDKSKGKGGKGGDATKPEPATGTKRDRGGKALTNTAGQLLLTNKVGASGKSPSDKEKFLSGGVFKVPCAETKVALLKDMGQWKGMDPCPFFHLSSKDCRDGDKCVMYH